MMLFDGWHEFIQWPSNLTLSWVKSRTKFDNYKHDYFPLIMLFVFEIYDNSYIYIYIYIYILNIIKSLKL